MANKYKYPDSYKWLGSDYRTDINERFTKRQLRYLLKYYTEIEIADLCDRWFMLFDHPEFGLITYHELLHKRIQEIQEENTAFSELIYAKVNTDFKRRKILEIGKEKINGMLKDLITELEDCGLTYCKIKPKKLFFLSKLYDLRFAFIEDATFWGAEFRNFRFEGAYLANSFFKFCRLGRVNFSATDCNSTSFGGSYITNTAFANSECKDSNFSHARMENIYFNYCNLNNVDFKSSTIYGNFEHTDCSFADFRGTSIKQMYMNYAIFDNAKVGEHTILMPNGQSRKKMTSVNFKLYNKHTSFKNIDVSHLNDNRLSLFVRYNNGETIDKKGFAYFTVLIEKYFSDFLFGIKNISKFQLRNIYFSFIMVYLIYKLFLSTTFHNLLLRFFPMYYHNHFQHTLNTFQNFEASHSNLISNVAMIILFFCMWLNLFLDNKKIPNYLTYKKNNPYL